MKWFYIILVFSAVIPLRSEDIYVTQNGGGSTNSLVWLNTAGNWGAGAGKVSPGDTVHIEDTLTNTLTIQGSGTAGSPVVIAFGPLGGMSMAAPVFFIELNGQNYISIYGSNTCTIQCTANGTALANQVPANGIRANTPSHNILIQDLTITNLYRRTPASQTDENTYGECMFFTQCSDVTVLHCALSEAFEGIGFIPASSTTTNVVTSNLVANANSIRRINHGISVGFSTFSVTPTCYNVTIRSNQIDEFEVWDSLPAANTFHHDGIFLFGESTSYLNVCSNIDISFNKIGPTINPTTSSQGSASIYVQAYNQTEWQHARIYNNISITKAPMGWANGFINGWGSDWVVANNTCIGSTIIYVGGTNGFCFNNLIWTNGAVAGGIYLQDSVGSCPIGAQFTNAWSGTFSDFNICANAVDFGITGWSLASLGSSCGGSVGNLNTWQHYFFGNFDPHSTTNTLSLDANYMPVLGDTIATLTGTNLTSFGITNDYFGNARPAVGNWTIGALQNTNSVNLLNIISIGNIHSTGNVRR